MFFKGLLDHQIYLPAIDDEIEVATHYIYFIFEFTLNLILRSSSTYVAFVQFAALLNYSINSLLHHKHIWHFVIHSKIATLLEMFTNSDTWRYSRNLFLRRGYQFCSIRKYCPNFYNKKTPINTTNIEIFMHRLALLTVRNDIL